MAEKTISSHQKDLEYSYESSQPKEQRRHKILLVDDDPVMRRLVLEMLGHQYQVLTSSHGLELPRLMTEFVPDLLILDVMMPWVDGFQLCQTIKSSPAWRKTPIIFVSGKKNAVDIDSGLKNGAEAYLTKPFSMVDLLQKIKVLLGEPLDELL